MNIIQVKFILFSLSHYFAHLVAGLVASCPGQFILTRPTWVSKMNYFAKILLTLNYLNLKNVSIINIIQVKFSCLFCRIVL